MSWDEHDIHIHSSLIDKIGVLYELFFRHLDELLFVTVLRSSKLVYPVSIPEFIFELNEPI